MTYNPTAPDEIALCMMDVQTYIKRGDALNPLNPLNPLIKAALLHYQLEAIHPFESGNGKLGRICITQYLYNTQRLCHVILPVSEYLQAHKVEYFDRIRAVHDFGQYEQRIKFFLRAVAETAEASLQRIDAVLQMRAKNKAAISTCGKDAGYLQVACRCT